MFQDVVSFISISAAAFAAAGVSAPNLWPLHIWFDNSDRFLWINEDVGWCFALFDCFFVCLLPPHTEAHVVPCDFLEKNLFVVSSIRPRTEFQVALKRSWSILNVALWFLLLSHSVPPSLLHSLSPGRGAGSLLSDWRGFKWVTFETIRGAPALNGERRPWGADAGGCLWITLILWNKGDLLHSLCRGN